MRGKMRNIASQLESLITESYSVSLLISAIEDHCVGK